MSDLYSVTLRRKQIITTYDAKGKPSGTRETFIEETHHDTPAALVATYREKFPDAVVSVTRSEPTATPGRSSARTQFGTAPRRAERASDRQNRPQAASGGMKMPRHVPTMADAINAAVKREARS